MIKYINVATIKKPSNDNIVYTSIFIELQHRVKRFRKAVTNLDNFLNYKQATSRRIDLINYYHYFYKIYGLYGVEANSSVWYNRQI